MAEAAHPITIEEFKEKVEKELRFILKGPPLNEDLKKRLSQLRLYMVTYYPEYTNNTESNNGQGNNVQGNNVQGNNVQGNNGQGNNGQGNNGQGNNVQGNNVQGNNVQGNNVQGNKQKKVLDETLIIHGPVKLVGSVALILQAIYALENKKEKLGGEGSDKFEKLKKFVLDYLPLVDDYDIFIKSKLVEIMDNYIKLLCKGFIKQRDPDVIPSIDTMEKGIKMIHTYNCLEEDLKIKIDYIASIGLNPKKIREETPIDGSLVEYDFDDDFKINLSKVNELAQDYENPSRSFNNNSVIKNNLKQNIYKILSSIYIQSDNNTEQSNARGYDGQGLMQTRRSFLENSTNYYGNSSSTEPHPLRLQLSTVNSPQYSQQLNGNPNSPESHVGGYKRKQTKKKTINNKKPKKRSKKWACSSCGWSPRK
jgi:hypothetical protein